jgi:uncharacterized protein (TIGR02001 family)
MKRTAYRTTALGSFAAALLTTTALSTATFAADAAAPAAPAASAFKIAFNFGITSDYISRGVSQNARNPSVQGGVDLSYGMFYAGVLASAVKFGDNKIAGSYYAPFKASAEVDLYAGIKPVWKSSFGDFNFDFGTIYYGYPGAAESVTAGANTQGYTAGKSYSLAKLDYYEFKAGVNKDLWKDGNLATTIFFSPNGQFEVGKVWTSETTFTQAFAAWGKVVPSFSAAFGYQKGEGAAYQSYVANGKTNYIYGNAGVTLTYDEKIALDLRYWDTNISNAGGFCTAGPVGQCSGRAVASIKFTY